MEIKNEVKVTGYKQEDVNLHATMLLEEEHSIDIDPAMEMAEIITTPTNKLLDIMIGFGCSGDNLTNEEDKLRKLIRDELKNRARSNSL